MIIDIHTHTFPDALAARAVTSLSQNANIPAYTDGTCAGLCASMQRAGIDRAAMMPIATKPTQVRTINACSAQMHLDYPALHCFGTLHPAQEDWAEEIERLTTDGIPGVKLHPEYQQFYVDDPQYFPLYRALADAERILLLHAGVDLGIPPPVHCAPERLARVLDAVPGLTVIAAHMGGYLQWDEVEEHLIGRNIYFDTSYSLTNLGPARMVKIIQAHGPEHVLFGTDSPWADQTSAVADIRALALSDAEKAAVLGENACRLLEIR